MSKNLIVKINNQKIASWPFRFSIVVPADIETETKILNSYKVRNFQNISQKLELADINPVHKKNDSTLVKNHRPISV